MAGNNIQSNNHSAIVVSKLIFYEILFCFRLASVGTQGVPKTAVGTSTQSVAPTVHDVCPRTRLSRSSLLGISLKPLLSEISLMPVCILHISYPNSMLSCTTVYPAQSIPKWCVTDPKLTGVSGHLQLATSPG